MASEASAELGDLLESTLLPLKEDKTLIRKGLNNYGATCYLNSVLKAVATTRLRFLFHPDTRNQMHIKDYQHTTDETDAQFKSRMDVKESLWQLTEGLIGNGEMSPASLGELQSATFDGLRTAFSHTLPEIFDRPNWTSTQHDAEELLRGLLGEYLDSNPNQLQSSLIAESGGDFKGKASQELTLRLYLNKEKESLSSLLKRNLNAESPREFVTAPDTLVLQLARFQYNLQTQSTYKQKDTVIPDLMVDVPLVLDPIPATYRLKGVIAHVGSSANSGHYIYFEYRHSNPSNPYDNSIWIHDDNEVTEVPHIGPLENLIHKPEFQPLFTGSYLLFYEKIDATNPS